MSQKKRKRRRTPYQKLGIEIALRLGLPQTCPLWNSAEGHEDQCHEDEQYCHNPELDLETNMDYRLCDVFSQWFWREVQKIESGLASEIMKPEAEPEGN